jgi:hypothetical protein
VAGSLADRCPPYAPSWVAASQPHLRRHSIVWSAVCKHSRKPIIVKAYIKVTIPDCCILMSQHRAIQPSQIAHALTNTCCACGCNQHRGTFTRSGTSLGDAAEPCMPHCSSLPRHLLLQAKMSENNHHQVRREIRLMTNIQCATPALPPPSASAQCAACSANSQSVLTQCAPSRCTARAMHHQAGSFVVGSGQEATSTARR